MFQYVTRIRCCSGLARCDPDLPDQVPLPRAVAQDKLKALAAGAAIVRKELEGR